MTRTDKDRKGSSGSSAFIVEKCTPGLSLGNIDKKMGQKGAHTCDVIFENVRIPAANLIGGTEGVGFKTPTKVHGGLHHEPGLATGDRAQPGWHLRLHPLA